MLCDAVALAVEALSWMELSGLSERQGFIKTARQLEIGNMDSLRLAFRIMTETLRRLNTIDMMINYALVPKRIGDLKLGVKNFLRLFTYWVHFRKANSRETVEFLNCGRKVLGPDELQPAEYSLGKILITKLDMLTAKTPEPARVGYETYHEEWFVQYCYRLLGRDEALRMLKRNSRPPPIYIRTNRLREDSDKAVDEIMSEGVSLVKVEGVKDLWRVDKTPKPLVKLKSYRKGMFQIQDLASQVACLAADPKPGSIVLDVCAAPGVKTCSLAQLMGNEGLIISVDISKVRMKVWSREMHRMGVKSTYPIICDARQCLPFKIFVDVTLLDPPCSNSGLFAKAPSAKWRVKPPDIQRLAANQYRMLEESARHVKVGGTLVYSTCSILMEENELIIERFLKLHPEFTLSPIQLSLGSDGLRGLDDAKRFYTHRDESNGYFIAKIMRLEQTSDEPYEQYL
ncbi:RsmB/NOP family class I SAM-dependent RNA methyltransferase [Candidatus Bathyarchaeota archaeon]|nr:RsmB/NOP family class I SAM-dependent RNA methyltransferase [Candidatus Bathyarchaeota archaeon]